MSPPKPILRNRACILEECGPYYIDAEYEKLGKEQGWLIATGWFYDHNDELVITYRLKE